MSDTGEPDDTGNGTDGRVPRDGVVSEFAATAADFRELLRSADRADLSRRSDGTLWNNRQLLFHMLFGYLLVLVLRHVVMLFSRLPPTASRAFARVLSAGTRPFHVVNYLASLGGGRVLGRRGMIRLFGWATRRLQVRARGDDEAVLARSMHFPVGWDPYFRDVMTMLELYHYPTQHYVHHRRQLTIPANRPTT